LIGSYRYVSNCKIATILLLDNIIDQNLWVCFRGLHYPSFEAGCIQFIFYCYVAMLILCITGLYIRLSVFERSRSLVDRKPLKRNAYFMVQGSPCCSRHCSVKVDF